MQIWEAIYNVLSGASAVTNLTTSIFHGHRPSTDDVSSAINYFQLPGVDIAADTNGVIEMPDYQISCRATTPGNAQDLAQAVGATLQNYKGYAGSAFSINIAKKIGGGGLIVEQDGDWYHVPLRFRFVYQNNESS